MPDKDYSVKIEDLTNNVQTDSEHSVTGDGIFDTLMETVSKHMQSQFDAGRIQGTEYSTVYLNALQATLELSTKILLSKGLTEQQVKEAIAKTALSEKQALLIDKQIEELNAKIALLDQQLLREIEQTKLIQNQAEKTSSEQTIAETQSEKDALLKDKQIGKLTYELENILPVQKDRIVAESNTEAEKKLLVKAQKVGFEADFRLKHSKMLWDAWSVGFSVAQDDPTMEGAVSLLTKANIQNTLTSLTSILNKFPTDT